MPRGCCQGLIPWTVGLGTSAPCGCLPEATLSSSPCGTLHRAAQNVTAGLHQSRQRQEQESNSTEELRVFHMPLLEACPITSSTFCLLEVGHQFSPPSREDFAQKHGYQETGSLRGHLRAAYRKKDLINSDHPSLESSQNLNNSFEAECHNTPSQISLIMCALCHKKQQKLIILSHIYNRNTFPLMSYLTGVLFPLE